MITREEAKGHFGKGWAGLVDDLFDFCEEWISTHVDEKVKIDGRHALAGLLVKEKYGGFRIDFYQGAPDSWHDFVWWLETKSRRICEVCGAAGTVNTTRGWHKTLCPEHWKVGNIYDA